ncbi:MAG: hypothetical protein PUP92_29870 [Rhizonema sp. PD38]|nr:hypothetical protein [Rhizonema sp. PD38]
MNRFREVPTVDRLSRKTLAIARKHPTYSQHECKITYLLNLLSWLPWRLGGFLTVFF